MKPKRASARRRVMRDLTMIRTEGKQMNRFIYRQPIMRRAGLWLYALLSLCENDFVLCSSS
jgi:hypothetical protein